PLPIFPELYEQESRQHDHHWLDWVSISRVGVRQIIGHWEEQEQPSEERPFALPNDGQYEPSERKCACQSDHPRTYWEAAWFQHHLFSIPEICDASECQACEFHWRRANECDYASLGISDECHLTHLNVLLQNSRILRRMKSAPGFACAVVIV